ncbi:MAG: LysE family translocator [Pseudomonadota bacterium]
MGMQEWMAYVGTVLVFMSTPGPSQLLMLSNSIGSGFRRSLFTAGGDLTANLLQMLVACVGLVSLIVGSRSFFVVVKWAGVAYLVYLGLKLVLSKPNAGLDRDAPKKSRAALYWQGFFTSAANPKAVVFFAALFPLFIDPERALASQFVILSATYLVIDGTFLCMYGKGADWISRKLRPTARQHLNRVAGSFLLGAAVLLGLKDMERR